jgi:hypothetical protein
MVFATVTQQLLLQKINDDFRKGAQLMQFTDKGKDKIVPVLN